LRSISRNSATVFADESAACSTGRVVASAARLACERARCWRPRAWPPFFAAALRALEPEPVDLDLGFALVVDFALLALDFDPDEEDAERERDEEPEELDFERLPDRDDLLEPELDEPLAPERFVPPLLRLP